MKITKFVVAIAVSLMALSTLAHAQKGKSKLRPAEITVPPVDYLNNSNIGSLSPTVGSNYSIVFGFTLENPIDGSSAGSALGLRGFPDGNGGFDPILEGVMDGLGEAIGTDLAFVFGVEGDESNVESNEELTSFGLDPFGSGRFLLELSVFVEATGTTLLWDTLDTDTNGDGIFDAGDGVADQPFPLDPVGLLFQVDLDGDGDPTNDPPSPAVASSLFIGGVSFDPAAGPIVVLEANWIFRDFDGELADLDLDGVGDGPFDVTTFAVFGEPLAGWQGDFNVGFSVDGDITTTQETVGGHVKTNGLTVIYLSDIEAEFTDILCGDVNLDGELNLLDIAPFVDLIVSGVYQQEGDINGDGVVNLLDVPGMVEKIIGS